MNYIQQIERLQKLIRLIDQERTGTPEELAEQLGISKRQLHNELEAIRNLGATLEYCKRGSSYRFDNSKLDIQFSLSLIKEEENRKIFGGVVRKLRGCNFISLCTDTFVMPKGWNESSSA